MILRDKFTLYSNCRACIAITIIYAQNKLRIEIKKWSIDAVTDSDKLASCLHAVFVLYVAGVNTLMISSPNELWDEKQLREDNFSFLNKTGVISTCIKTEISDSPVFWRNSANPS